MVHILHGAYLWNFFFKCCLSESNLTGRPVFYLVTLDGKAPGGYKWGSGVIDLCLWKIGQLGFLAEYFTCYFSDSQCVSWFTVSTAEWFPGVPLFLLPFLDELLIFSPPGLQPKCGCSWEAHSLFPTCKSTITCHPPLQSQNTPPLAEHLCHIL